jgi:hypothetical protein
MRLALVVVIEWHLQSCCLFLAPTTHTSSLGCVLLSLSLAQIKEGYF